MLFLSFPSLSGAFPFLSSFVCGYLMLSVTLSKSVLSSAVAVAVTGAHDVVLLLLSWLPSWGWLSLLVVCPCSLFDLFLLDACLCALRFVYLLTCLLVCLLVVV